MDAVRPFTRDDIPAVGSLFQRVFRHTDAPPSRALLGYFESLYFCNPWFDPEIPSLVHDTDGKVDGFLGVYPSLFEFKGAPVRMATGGNYMVDPELRNPLVGAKIIRTFFAGRQDMALSDTSNERGKKMWEGLGSTTLQTYSILWLRVLRPAGFGVSLLQRSVPGIRLDTFMRPFSVIVDAAVSGPAKSPLHEEPSRLTAIPLTPAFLAEGIRTVTSSVSFRPLYTEETLAWLISMAGQKREFGAFSSSGLLDSDGSMAGWYLYYPNPGRIGQVLQIGAASGKLDRVLAHLFEEARKKGSVALVGRADPNSLSILTAHRCLFFQRGMYTQVKTKRQDLLIAFLAGDAFLTRLEGEWWTRLQGDKFDESGVGPE